MVLPLIRSYSFLGYGDVAKHAHCEDEEAGKRADDDDDDDDNNNNNIENLQQI
jgi:hypothetical protein